MKKLVVLVLGIMLVFPIVVNAVFTDVAENHLTAPYIKTTENYLVMEKDEINSSSIDEPIARGGMFSSQNNLTRIEASKTLSLYAKR